MIKFIFILPVRFYRYFISPILGSKCRFYPSCSEYCIKAIEIHGVILGLYLTSKRILRCNPFCQSGADPVPNKQDEFFPIALKKKSKILEKDLDDPNSTAQEQKNLKE